MLVLVIEGAVPLAAVAGSTATPAAPAAADGPLTWSATVNGEKVDAISAQGPLALEPDEPLRLQVKMRNTSKDRVTVDEIRLRGQVIGLTFFSFGFGTDFTLEPEAEAERVVVLRTDELNRQAVGLIPADLQVVDADRDVVASKSFAVDVQGSLASAYGLFGLSVLVVTVVLLLRLLAAILKERLPVNRWVRATRFAAPGLGIGLTLTFTLSALRLLTPDALVWLPLVAGCGAVGFAVGYVLPTPVADEQEEHDEDELADDVPRGDYDELDEGPSGTVTAQPRHRKPRRSLSETMSTLRPRK